MAVDSKINPSDCVDMDCDALKKALVVDTDGSLLGVPGSVLPNAGFEWDGDSRRGIGDYRIPKVDTSQNHYALGSLTLRVTRQDPEKN